jgi:hypothetical protein
VHQLGAAGALECIPNSNTSLDLNEEIEQAMWAEPMQTPRQLVEAEALRAVGIFANPVSDRAAKPIICVGPATVTTVCGARHNLERHELPRPPALPPCGAASAARADGAGCLARSTPGRTSFLTATAAALREPRTQVCDPEDQTPLRQPNYGWAASVLEKPLQRAG